MDALPPVLTGYSSADTPVSSAPNSTQLRRLCFDRSNTAASSPTSAACSGCRSGGGGASCCAAAHRPARLSSGGGHPSRAGRALGAPPGRWAPPATPAACCRRCRRAWGADASTFAPMVLQHRMLAG